MLWLRQGTEVPINLGQRDKKPKPMLSKNGAPPEKPSNKAKKDEAHWWSLMLSAADTDTCGRFELFDPGKEFMVVSANYYDSTVLGADYLEVDVKQVASAKKAADDLASFAVAGYDADTQTLHSIAKIESVGRVVELVNANIVSVMSYGPAAENLCAAFDERVGYQFPKCSLPQVKSVSSIVSADVRAIQGKGADNLYAAFCGGGFDFKGSSMPAIARVKYPVHANIVSIADNREAADGLADFATLGYDAEEHEVQRVALTEMVAHAKEPLLANVVEVMLSGVAADHLSKAFNGEGFDFLNCSLPDVKHISEIVSADLRTICGDKVAPLNMASAFNRTGFDFEKCSIPAVGELLNVPSVDIDSIAGETEVVSTLIDLLTKGYDVTKHEVNIPVQSAQAPVPVGSGDLVTILGDELAAENLRRCFGGDGFDFPGSILDVRVRGGAQRLKVESIEKRRP